MYDQPIWVDDFMVADYKELYNYLGIYTNKKDDMERKRTVRHCVINGLKYRGIRLSHTPPKPTDRPYIEKIHTKGDLLLRGHVTMGLGLYR